MIGEVRVKNLSSCWRAGWLIKRERRTNNFKKKFIGKAIRYGKMFFFFMSLSPTIFFHLRDGYKGRTLGKEDLRELVMMLFVRNDSWQRLIVVPSIVCWWVLVIHPEILPEAEDSFNRTEKQRTSSIVLPTYATTPREYQKNEKTYLKTCG